MKVKIVGISGSPRKNGNTKILVEEALGAAKALGDIETEIIHLAEKTIYPCVGNACEGCVTAKSYCTRYKGKDDMYEIYSALENADGIIIGSPVYWGGVTAQVKALMDRTRPFSYLGSKLKNKVGGAIAVGMAKGVGEETTLHSILDFFLIHKMVVVGCEIGPFGAYGVPGVTGSKAPDAVKKDEEALSMARNLGVRVAQIAKALKSC